MTQFQKKLLNDKDAQWCIIRNMHKEFWDNKNKENILKKVQVSSNYNWVCIEGRIKGYGVIALAVTNDVCTCSGRGYTIESFQKIRDQNRFTFRLWRTTLDKLCDEQKEDDHIAEYIIIDKLKSMGYEPILAHEYFEYYYKD